VKRAIEESSVKKRQETDTASVADRTQHIKKETGSETTLPHRAK